MELEQMVKDCTGDSHRWFPGEAQSLQNQVLCMAGEVGEVANLVKKIVRGSLKLEDVRDELALEVIDVLVYLCNLLGNKAFEGIEWGALWRVKRDFNEARFAYTDPKPVTITVEGDVL